MDHFDIILSLVGVLFLAIIGVYVWTFKVSQNTGKSLGEIYKAVNSHIQNANIHTDKTEFVKVDVCKVVHESLSRDVREIKSDVKCLLAKRKI